MDDKINDAPEISVTLFRKRAKSLALGTTASLWIGFLAQIAALNDEKYWWVILIYLLVGYEVSLWVWLISKRVTHATLGYVVLSSISLLPTVIFMVDTSTRYSTQTFGVSYWVSLSLIGLSLGISSVIHFREGQINFIKYQRKNVKHISNSWVMRYPLQLKSLSEEKKERNLSLFLKMFIPFGATLGMYIARTYSGDIRNIFLSIPLFLITYLMSIDTMRHLGIAYQLHSCERDLGEPIILSLKDLPDND